MEARNKELNQKIAKLRQELLQKKPAVEENGELIYNSRFLKMIELCLASKDIIFDTPNVTYDSMVDMKRPVLDKSLYSQAGINSKSKDLFYELTLTRQLFQEESRQVGNSLRKELEVEDDYYTSKPYNRDSEVEHPETTDSFINKPEGSASQSPVQEQQSSKDMPDNSDENT